MRKFALVALLVSGALAGSSQQIQEESVVVNVEVPVRIFQGTAFIDSLRLEDFELYEGGVRQKIEAVYLIKKRAIARRDEEKRFKPEIGRSFYLFFELSEYIPRLNEALHYFVHDVLAPGDNLVLVTPAKTYRLRNEAMAVKKKEEILNQFNGVLRRDVVRGNSEYKMVMQELEDLAKAMSKEISRSTSAVSSNWLFETDGSLSSQYEGKSVDDLLQRYADLLGLLDNIRTVDQKRILDFSDFLKAQAGQKYVFLFYQKEFMPRIDPKVLYLYMDLYQDRPDVQHTLTGLFEFYRKEYAFNPDQIMKAFSDSSLSCHFLFLTPPSKSIPGIRFEEQSDDIFSTFRQIARAGGGFIDGSSNPVQLMHSAVEASENYYLLYYSPQKYVKDGNFKDISVRVKNPGYKVVHRLGYFAR